MIRCEQQEWAPDELEEFARKIDQIRQLRKSPGDEIVLGEGFDDIPNNELNLWSSHAQPIYEAQYQKCGYCESKLLNSFQKDVDHFRPKGRVDLLDHDQFGVEQNAFVNRIRGRKPRPWSDVGYSWLRNDWRNYVGSCPTCNRKYKGAIFPTELNTTQKYLPGIMKSGIEDRENPFLLNPWLGEDPENHLSYTPNGFVYATVLPTTQEQSQLGRNSIDVYGLNRLELIRARYARSKEVKFRIREYIRARREDSQSRRSQEALVRLKELVSSSSAYAGMARFLVRVAGLSEDCL